MDASELLIEADQREATEPDGISPSIGRHDRKVSTSSITAAEADMLPESNGMANGVPNGVETASTIVEEGEDEFPADTTIDTFESDTDRLHGNLDPSTSASTSPPRSETATDAPDEDVISPDLRPRPGPSQSVSANPSGNSIEFAQVDLPNSPLDEEADSARESYRSMNHVPALAQSMFPPPNFQHANGHQPLGYPIPALSHNGGLAHVHAPIHAMPPASIILNSGNEKRRIHLRLYDDTPPSTQMNGRKSGLFQKLARRSSTRLSFMGSMNGLDQISETALGAEKGKMTVSWYQGTTSLELQEHVRCSVVRKLGIKGTTKLVDMRILDDTVDPPEEIVLSPYLPDGSSFVLRFVTADSDGTTTPVHNRRYSRYTDDGPPESPSAAPSPHPNIPDLTSLGLNANQLALLGARLQDLQIPSVAADTENAATPRAAIRKSSKAGKESLSTVESQSLENQPAKGNGEQKVEDDVQSKTSETADMPSLHPEDPIEARLRQITELLIAEKSSRYVPRQEKKQVVFVLANYFVLFLSLIAISAEIQARAPEWHASLESNFKRVQTCAMDQDSLFECVSTGDFAGLIASVLLWVSRSAATKRIFLFGFESPNKLWTVVYESLVTAVCWGFSYMFIRRGMNPDTSRNFLQKYWKDAVYGSLAGFNAAFMKQVLKNLIPQEAIENVVQERQLKILSWLPSFS